MLHLRWISRLSPLPRRGFTLVELLIVIGIVGVLLAILMPVLGAANLASKRAKCLSNIRNMQTAQWMYVNENKGYLIQAGLSHGGHTMNEQGAWINTLQTYYSNRLLLRTPIDDSPQWDLIVAPCTTLRKTSYGINDFLDRDMCPWGGPYVKINQIPRTSATIQFIIMAFTGEFAVADHPHVENWVGNIPAKAQTQIQINAYGGKRASYEAFSNYGFLDGHAESLRFGDVFTNFTKNKFDPQVAQ